MVDGESMSESGFSEGDGGEQASAQSSSQDCLAVGDCWFGGVVGAGCFGCIAVSAATSAIADSNIADRPLEGSCVGVGGCGWGVGGFLKKRNKSGRPCGELGVGVVSCGRGGGDRLKRLSELWWVGTKSAFELWTDGVVGGVSRSSSMEEALKTSFIFESAPP